MNTENKHTSMHTEAVVFVQLFFVWVSLLNNLVLPQKGK